MLVLKAPSKLTGGVMQYEFTYLVPFQNYSIYDGYYEDYNERKFVFPADNDDEADKMIQQEITRVSTQIMELNKLHKISHKIKPAKLIKIVKIWPTK